MSNFCTNCGSPLTPGDRFCQNCGAKLEIPAVSVPEEPETHFQEPPVTAAVSVNPSDSLPAGEVPSSGPQIHVSPSNDSLQQQPQTQPFVSPASPVQNPSASDHSSFSTNVPPASSIQNPSQSNMSPSVPFQNSAGGSVPPQNSSVPPASATNRTPASSTGKKPFNPIIYGVIGVIVLFILVLGVRKLTRPKPSVIATPNPAIIAKPTPSAEAPLPSAATPEATQQPGLLKDTADFETYRIPCAMKLGQDTDYTAVYSDDSSDITGNLVFTDYTVNPVTEQILEFGEENDMDLEDYQLKELTSHVSFSSSEIGEREVIVTRYMTDYYDIDQCDDTWETLKDSWDDTYSRYEVDWENETKYVYIWVDHDWTSDNGSLIYEEHVTALVPNGYDGLIRGYIYPNIESEDIRDIDDYSQVYLFRMN